MTAAALVLLAFVALCVGCAIFEALTRPGPSTVEAVEPDYAAAELWWESQGRSQLR